MENPIRKIRLDRRMTLQEFAELCQVHLQLVFLTEQGCYHSIPPAILTSLDLQGRTKLIELEYADFQREKRIGFGRMFSLGAFSVTDLGPPAPNHPPVEGFRARLGIHEGHPNGLARMSFAKCFCISSSELFDLENGRKAKLSEQFKEAMRHAGLDATVLNELQFRQREYASGEWVSSGNKGQQGAA